MQDAGIKVLRTWVGTNPQRHMKCSYSRPTKGFNAINGSELDGALDSGLTYYQVWNSSEWALNTGPQGLQRLDKVIETAGRHGIKVILTLTNNWVGYGGAELYINWIAGAGQPHDVFYTDRRIVASYQRTILADEDEERYVRAIVERYKNSPNIFAWELINEARCLGDLPAGPNCVPFSGTISRWYEDQANFVRRFWANGVLVSDYNFDGQGVYSLFRSMTCTHVVPQAGEDFDKDLALENIDFGTYVSRSFVCRDPPLMYQNNNQHMYPQYWYSDLVRGFSYGPFHWVTPNR
ncbi:glycoside hydrolase family protein [Salix suchowensis]|nr:glycoside hydrolase family protein [Salix suchowensis]